MSVSEKQPRTADTAECPPANRAGWKLGDAALSFICCSKYVKFCVVLLVLFVCLYVVIDDCHF